MDKIERLDTVLKGSRPDRAPVSFWYHFSEECASGNAAVEAHVRHIEKYDLDFLKIMDDNRYPRLGLRHGVIAEIGDLERLPELKGDEDSFARQLELISTLANRFHGRLRMITTIFNSWSTLRSMILPASGKHGPPVFGQSDDARDHTMTRFLLEAPGALSYALDIITESLSKFVRNCLEAGADGIFFSVRDDWVDRPENKAGTYSRVVQPGDFRILKTAGSGSFNMLHICGQIVDFKRFGNYPVHAVNWADRYAGPSIASVSPWLRPAICGGLDNLGTMKNGSPEDCEKEAVDAMRQAGDRPIILAPGCTFDAAAVPEKNLRAIRRIVETGANQCAR
jgi:uroporphyrinogen decarboxylase